MMLSFGANAVSEGVGLKTIDVKICVLMKNLLESGF